LAAVLRPFILQLSQPVLFQLSKDCFEDPRKKTMVNYSKYFKHIEPSDWENAELHTFVQLIEQPPEAIEENVNEFDPDAVNAQAEIGALEEDPESG